MQMKELLTRLQILDQCQRIELEVAESTVNPNHRRARIDQVNTIYKKAEKITMQLYSARQLNEFNTLKVLRAARSS